MCISGRRGGRQREPSEGKLERHVYLDMELCAGNVFGLFQCEEHNLRLCSLCCVLSGALACEST